MGKLFGGSSQKSSSTSTSSNRAYDDINRIFSPVTGMAGTGANALSALLSGDSSGFDAFKNATGFDWQAEQGSRGITGNAAAKGLLNSGSTGKALVSYGNNIQNQFANNYMDKLLQQAQLGLQAGGLISGAGNVSSSTSSSSGSSKPGLGGLIGGIASGVAKSDRRAKKNIFKVGELKNGLNLYQYRYNDDTGPFIGVMADEVAKVMPEALGPIIDGFQTVNYDKIKGDD